MSVYPVPGSGDLLAANNLTDVASVVAARGTLFPDPANLVLGVVTGTQIGTAVEQKVALHGAVAVVQRAGIAQTAVIGTASTAVAPFGFATAAQADALVTLVNELRAALVEKGIVKGAA